MNALKVDDRMECPDRSLEPFRAGNANASQEAFHKRIEGEGGVAGVSAQRVNMDIKVRRVDGINERKDGVGGKYMGGGHYAEESIRAALKISDDLEQP